MPHGAPDPCRVFFPACKCSIPHVWKACSKFSLLDPGGNVIDPGANDSAARDEQDGHDDPS
jgi:hypothetical protein